MVQRIGVGSYWNNKATQRQADLYRRRAQAQATRDQALAEERAWDRELQRNDLSAERLDDARDYQMKAEERSRAFQSEQAELGRDYGAEQAQAGRDFSREQSDIGYERGLRGTLAGAGKDPSEFGTRDELLGGVAGIASEEKAKDEKEKTDKKLEDKKNVATGLGIDLWDYTIDENGTIDETGLDLAIRQKQLEKSEKEKARDDVDYDKNQRLLDMKLDKLESADETDIDKALLGLGEDPGELSLAEKKTLLAKKYADENEFKRATTQAELELRQSQVAGKGRPSVQERRLEQEMQSAKTNAAFDDFENIKGTSLTADELSTMDETALVSYDRRAKAEAKKIIDNAEKKATGLGESIGFGYEGGAAWSTEDAENMVSGIIGEDEDTIETVFSSNKDRKLIREYFFAVTAASDLERSDEEIAKANYSRDILFDYIRNKEEAILKKVNNYKEKNKLPLNNYKYLLNKDQHKTKMQNARRMRKDRSNKSIPRQTDMGTRQLSNTGQNIDPQQLGTVKSDTTNKDILRQLDDYDYNKRQL